jgi:hypothetical protein
MNQRPITPAVNLLRETILNTITSRDWSYREENENRTRLQWRAGCGQKQHLTGMALDIILYSRAINQKVLAHNLFALFARYQPVMRWVTMIYEDVCLVARGGTLEVQTYFDKERRHYTHLHIDWYRPNSVQGETVTPTPESQSIGFDQQLRPHLIEMNQRLASNQLSPLNLRQIPLGLYQFENVGR